MTSEILVSKVQKEKEESTASMWLIRFVPFLVPLSPAITGTVDQNGGEGWEEFRPKVPIFFSQDEGLDRMAGGRQWGSGFKRGGGGVDRRTLSS